MIDQLSLDITKIELQKAIVKLLYEKEDITLNQYSLVMSKFDKKIQDLKRKNKAKGGEAKPIIVNIKI